MCGELLESWDNTAAEPFVAVVVFCVGLQLVE